MNSKLIKYKEWLTNIWYSAGDILQDLHNIFKTKN